jgi:hypothetical protein
LIRFRLECNTNLPQSLFYFKTSLNSHLIATCFGLTRPSSGNFSPTETAALHRFSCQCIPCYCASPVTLKCVCVKINILCSALFSFCCVDVVPLSCLVLTNAPLTSSPGRFTSWERVRDSHWTRRWVVLRGCLNSMKREIFLFRESNPGYPARSQSLYRLSYPDSWKGSGRGLTEIFC